ncbi:uncharacterized protein RCO7_09310 [Rhynchosporium graminicola]|uniref:Uncharacterized protein n=1 Tax=Rhynchosporium graminicola TaxID=2792576 RepID=A0A1E1LSP9_9HELO|nr:uncharacterized protein RCO7_09310 [Rhynchosporium commune]
MAASVIATPPDAIKDSIARGVEARKEGINCDRLADLLCVPHSLKNAIVTIIPTVALFATAETPSGLVHAVRLSNKGLFHAPGQISMRVRFYKTGGSESSVLLEGLRWA